MNRHERRRAARERMTDADALNATGEFVSQIADPKTGAPLATIKRLPGGWLAADVEGDEALALVRDFLPQTRTAMAVTPSGARRYRLIYKMPGGAP
jgi:hypothetical protein